jgi:hypothetical protein
MAWTAAQRSSSSLSPGFVHHLITCLIFDHFEIKVELLTLCSSGQKQSFSFKALIFWGKVKVLLGLEN